MSNRAISASSDEATTPFNGQRGITVGHGRVPSVCQDEGLAISHPAAEEPVPQTPQPVSTSTTS